MVFEVYKMSFNYVSANCSLFSSPVAYIPNTPVSTSKLLDDKAVIGALCPSAAKFALATDQREMIGGEAALDDAFLLTEQDLADIKEAREHGIELDIVHMSEAELEREALFLELPDDLKDVQVPLVSGVKFASGYTSYSSRYQEYNEVTLPIMNFDFLDSMSQPLEMVKCKVKFECPLEGIINTLTVDEAFNLVLFYGRDLATYIHKIFSYINFALNTFINQDLLDAGQWHDLEQWHWLDKRIDDVMCELSRDSGDVWYSPSQLIEASQYLENDALRAVAMKLIISHASVNK